MQRVALSVLLCTLPKALYHDWEAMQLMDASKAAPATRAQGVDTPSASDHDKHGGRTSRELMRAAASSRRGRPGCGAGAGTSRQVRPCRNPARHAAMHTKILPCMADF